VTESLFRQEAVEFHARGREAVSGVLRLDPRWLRRSYWLTLAVVIAGLALGVVARTDATTTGPAVVDGRAGTFAALLPATVASQLEDARSLRLRIAERGGGPPWSGVLTRVQPAEPAPVRRAGLDQPREPAMLVTGRLLGAVGRSAPLPGQAGLDGRVTIVLRSERIASVFGDRLRGMFGAGEEP